MEKNYDSNRALINHIGMTMLAGTRKCMKQGKLIPVPSCRLLKATRNQVSLQGDA